MSEVLARRNAPVIKDNVSLKLTLTNELQALGLEMNAHQEVAVSVVTGSDERRLITIERVKHREK